MQILARATPPILCESATTVTRCARETISALMLDSPRCSHGVLWLAYQYPFVRIDGIRDGKERMRRYWKIVEEECERINAEMERKRKNP